MIDSTERLLKGYKFRIYPTEEQKLFFDNTFGACRYVWNFMLDVKKNAYLELGVGLNYCDTSKGLTEIKEFDDCEFLRKTNSQSIQQELRRLDLAYSGFFKKQSDFPKFKSKKDKQSFIIPQHFVYRNDGKNGVLSIPKLKPLVQVVQSKEFGDNFEIKSLTISKTKTNKYFCSFLVEEDIKVKEHKSNNSIGIDLGLIDLMVFSDGTKIKNPKIAKQYRKKLEYKSRQLSKKVKDSKNKEKARLSLAETFEKISNIKLDYTHKLTSKIINENQVIVMEDLNVSGMMKNHKLARSIQEVSWGEVVRQLKYKAEWNDRQFIQIDRFFPSSKTCNNDGFVVDKLPLDVRSWTCPKCGSVHDRDINAAKNILKQGLNIINETKSGSGTESDSKQKHGEALRKVLVKTKRNIKSMNHELSKSLS
jgi:putative transposase